MDDDWFFDGVGSGTLSITYLDAGLTNAFQVWSGGAYTAATQPQGTGGTVGESLRATAARIGMKLE